MLEVRCPYCHAKLAEGLMGVLLVKCRQCSRRQGRTIIVKIDTRVAAGVH